MSEGEGRAMRIAVCVKQVLDTTPSLRVVDGAARQAGPRPITQLGLADCAALEIALAVRARAGGEITAVSVGEAEAVRALRFCLACGADRALHIRRADGLDAAGSAAAVVRTLGAAPVDLIVSGAVSGDGASGLFPAVVAHELGWPLVTCVAAVIAEERDCRQPNGWLAVQRRLERGDRQIVRCPLPAVLAVDGVGVELPYLSLRARRRAERMPIDERRGCSGNGWGGELIALEVPRPRPKRTGGPDPQLSAMDRLQHLLAGGMQPKRSGSFVEGNPGSVAAEILRFLEERGFISTGGNSG